MFMTNAYHPFVERVLLTSVNNEQWRVLHQSLGSKGCKTGTVEHTCNEHAFNKLSEKTKTHFRAPFFFLSLHQ